MSIVNCLKVIVIKPLYKFVRATYVSINTLHANVRAIENKDRSLRALEKLDARLLEDVGLCRVDDKVLSLKEVRAISEVNALEHERKLKEEASALSKRRLSVINRRNASARAKDYELLQEPLE